jgi:hypothetical protein
VAELRDITIHAGDEPVISAALAARRYGIPSGTMRSTLARLRGDGIIEPVAETLDERTPLYPLAALDLVVSTRPGKGAARRRTEERPMATLTVAMHPAYQTAHQQLVGSNWPADVTERAAREVASELWRLRKEAGRTWKTPLRELGTGAEARRPFVGGLLTSLRAQGAKEVTPIPIDRAVQYAAQAMVEKEAAK